MLLHFIPDIRVQTQGREIILLFDADIGEATKSLVNRTLMKRRCTFCDDILDKYYSFDGSFKPGCVKEAVPDSDHALVRVILNTPSIESQKETPVVSTAIVFRCLIYY